MRSYYPRLKRTNRLKNPLNLKHTSSSRRSRLPKSSHVVSTRLPKPAKPLTFWQKINPLRKRRFNFTWRKFLIGLGIAFAVFILMVTGVFAYYVRDLPNPRKVQERPIAQSTKILDRNGKNLYNIHGEENRTIVKGDQISDYLKKATVAMEDASFYEHHGFAVKGLTRAVVCRVTHNCVAGGGSTITQQYVKNSVLTDEYSLNRKLKELILAIEIEQTYSKEEILVGYLNEIPYGSNAYGVEMAAQTFFGKPAKDLNLSESAVLAALINRPTYLSPYGNHLDELFARKNLVLERMVRVGYITQEEADKAKSEAPSLDSPNFKNQQDLLAPHFVFYVRERLIEILGGDPREAEQELDQAGFVVTTSIDLPTQQMAEKILAEMGPEAVKKYHATNAALSAVDPKTGEILAMVGSIDYENSRSGNTNFANALLQPGSSFKPIVYATAFGPNYRYSPASITYDLQTDFGKYKPNNYDGKFRGPITNRQALAGSLNIPAVKNLYLAGIKESIDTAKAMGITTLNRPINEYGLSLVLGSGEVRPVEMASAYATFANGGMHNPLRPILKIEKDGQIFKDYTKTEAAKAIEPEVAYQISSILSDNNARSYIFGTKNNLVLADRPVAAKSGTTENNRDAWTIGYTPSIATAVWVGNNEPNKTMTKGADGSYVAAPIWNRFMREYLKDKPVDQFPRPGTIKELAVDRLSGKLPSDQSPQDQLITDIFAPWQIPKDKDDVHVKVKIDKVSGKLATDLTPPDQVEERLYFNIHSEVPDNPNWENPVQEWAKANGGGIVPPTEKDDVHTEEGRPTLSFISPVNGSSVSGRFKIEVSPGGIHPISSAEFFLNNVSIGTRSEAPWSVEYNSDSLPPGSQIIQVTVTNSIGMVKSDQISVTTAKDTSPPGNVISPSATDGSKLFSRPIRLSWINPSNSDLVSVNIYQSLSNDPVDLGVKVKNVAVTPDSTSTVDIETTTFNDNKTYYFILRTVDSSGNENQYSKKISAKISL